MSALAPSMLVPKASMTFLNPCKRNAQGRATNFPTREVEKKAISPTTIQTDSCSPSYNDEASVREEFEESS